MSVNVTIDDSDPAITYNGAWVFQACAACNVNPSSAVLSQLWGTTFHAATRVSDEDTPKEAVFTFNGTSVYLFGATLASAARPLVRDADMSFFVDNVYAGEFKRTAGTHDEANVQLFVQNNLSSSEHTLLVKLNANSVAVLDYLVYEEATDAVSSEYKTNVSFSSSSSATTTVLPPTADEVAPVSNRVRVTAIVITVFFLLVIMAAVVIWMRRKQRREPIEASLDEENVFYSNILRPNKWLFKRLRSNNEPFAQHREAKWVAFHFRDSPPKRVGQITATSSWVSSELDNSTVPDNVDQALGAAARRAGIPAHQLLRALNLMLPEQTRSDGEAIAPPEYSRRSDSVS
ncbi:hypothetical protein BKA62DRAFT_512590 [Auriculariales sp. MPI-PUGE-AT-0066]|nr:hypothetical protein BKA62DRAFT_512590 [Auriculariales sp. MPI-PUGE-AT-0066]